MAYIILRRVESAEQREQRLARNKRKRTIAANVKFEAANVEFAAFSEACVVPKLGAKTLASVVWEAYVAWSRATGLEPMTRKAFGSRAREVWEATENRKVRTRYLDIDVRSTDEGTIAATSND